MNKRPWEFLKLVPCMRGTSWIAAMAGLLVLVLVVSAGVAYRDYHGFINAPLRLPQETMTIDIQPGSALPGIVRILKDRQLTDAPWLYWRALAWQMSASTKLQAGEYSLTPDITPYELLRKMAAGDVVLHKFTIVDGWTFRQLLMELARSNELVQVTTTLSDAEIMRLLGAPDGKPEGYFLPETYAYVKGGSDLDLLKRAYTAMQQTLDSLWSQRDPDVPFATPYEALILASIVEKETGRAEERPKIAGVFLRRLKLGMRLQTDPSVIYGLGEAFQGNLTRNDLEVDTSFNTYTRAGLPPTPIALPGKAALLAVLHPEHGKNLYFVARGDGTHEFSESLEAHNRAVAKYQLHKNP